MRTITPAMRDRFERAGQLHTTEHGKLTIITLDKASGGTVLEPVHVESDPIAIRGIDSLVPLPLSKLDELWMETDEQMSMNAASASTFSSERHTDLATVRGWIMAAMDAHLNTSAATLDHLDALEGRGSYVVWGSWAGEADEPITTASSEAEARRIGEAALEGRYSHGEGEPAIAYRIARS